MAVRPFGSWKVEFQHALNESVGPDERIQGKVSNLGVQAQVFYYNREFSTLLNKSSTKWLKNMGFEDFSTVVGLSSESFEQKEQDLLGDLEKELKSHRDTLVREGRPGKKFGKKFSKGAAPLTRRTIGEKKLAKPTEGAKGGTRISVGALWRK